MMDPLRGFSEAWRDELRSSGGLFQETANGGNGAFTGMKQGRAAKATSRVIQRPHGKEVR
jgi:hypothetical protein